MTIINWNNELAEQLDWHWRTQFRPRLDGLTDEEYRWEPVPGAWNVRPRGTSAAPIAAGSGEFTIDFAIPEPTPAPVTTIAWRIGHIVVGVLGARVAAHFGGSGGRPPGQQSGGSGGRPPGQQSGGSGGRPPGEQSGGPAFDYMTHEYPGDAGSALAQLDAGYAAWIKGVRGLGEAGLARPCGPAEGPYADAPLAALVLHINREVLHHGAEIALLRDLYRWKFSAR
jgi:hypothetical protein